MKDFEKTIISQYANSPTLLGLIKSFNACVSPHADLDNFYKYIWNVMTAVGIGLDIWGAIVGVSRNLQVSNGPFFGFSGTGYQPWNQAPFYSGAGSTVTYALLDDAYRTLILVKALANISDCTVPSLNRLMSNLFAGRGVVYCNDLGGMRIEYVFNFTLTPVEVAILTTSGAVPRPCGVSYTVAQP